MQDKNEPEHQFTSLTSKRVISPKATEEEASYLGKRQYLKLFKAGTDTSHRVVIVTFGISWMPSTSSFDLARPRETSEVVGLLIVDEGYLNGHLLLTQSREPGCSRGTLSFQSTKSPRCASLGQGKAVSHRSYVDSESDLTCLILRYFVFCLI